VKKVVTVADLSDEEIDLVLRRAAELASGATITARPFILGTLFLTPSMRTRVGFSVAAQRLGGTSVAVDELRVDPAMSQAESLTDSLRVLAGMVDVVVARTDEDLRGVLPPDLPAALINGGGPQGHPSQALIDLAAIERFSGSPEKLHIGLCGDLRMRAATSLLQLLERRRVAQVSLMYPDDREPILPAGLAQRALRVEPEAVIDLDVLIMIGLPQGTGPHMLDAAHRASYALDSDRLARLPASAVVLSPLPVIDEITAEARRDPRIRIFEQSDHAVFVRMALLELMLDEGPDDSA
jgi:aspartate carbamoyltransferase catalytic subunit